MELRARFQPFQDRYDQAVHDGDTAVLIRICPNAVAFTGRGPGSRWQILPQAGECPGHGVSS
ncbi:hypothetical protein ABZT42_55830, partial [Streptomyces mirabilis]